MYFCTLPVEKGGVAYEPSTHFGNPRYQHYQKCGKSYKCRPPKEKKTGTCRWIRHEKEAIAPWDANASFTIAGIRNPCDYYLSLWAFGSDSQKSGFKDQNPELNPLYGKTKPYTNPADLDLFYRWVSHPKVRGLLTERVVGSVGWQPTGTMDTGAVDCWLHSDHLLPTLRVCLKEFESGGGRIDWEEFEKKVEAFDDEEKSVRNASPHGHCFEHYNSSLMAIVREADAGIFQMFPFSKCCSGVESRLHHW